MKKLRGGPLEVVPLFTFWLADPVVGVPAAGVVVLDHDMDAAVSSFLFYVHVAIDDNTRYGYAELLPDGNGATDAGFLIRAASYSPDTASNGSSVITDNAPAYRNSAAFRQAVADQGAVQRVPHRPEAEQESDTFKSCHGAVARQGPRHRD